MKKNKKIISSIVSLLVLIVALVSYYYPDIEKNIDNLSTNVSTKTKEVVELAGDLKVYFIDVGQADCIMISSDNKNVLIDAGNNEDGGLLVEYFKSLNVNKFDYVVGTHAHEDHIGGMDDIINNFDIGTFYMPDAMTTTLTFEDVLDALDNKGLKLNVPNTLEEFNIGEAKFKVLYTGTNKSDLNNTSIVLRMDYGNESFLFMGDATSQTEKKILDQDLDVDLLKVGHHGSEYSTSDDFLNKVNPKYAVIEVGNGNIYDHPKDITIKKLEQKNIKIYRTDKDGTIIVSSDGNSLDFKTVKTNTNGG